MQDLQFHKLHSLGNDFILLDGIQHPNLPELSTNFIQLISHRNYGVGCDQLLVINRYQGAAQEFSYQIFNQDGSQALQCGNGARCVMLYLKLQKLIPDNTAVLHTAAQTIHCTIMDDGLIAANLGKVSDYQQHAAHYASLMLGNPHAVLLNTPYQEELCQQIYASGHYPDGVNISFCNFSDDNRADVTVIERGAGRTLGCGSAAAACFVAARRLLNLQEQKLQLSFPGGKLTVFSDSKDGNPVVVGDAHYIFAGKFNLEYYHEFCHHR